VRENAQAVPVGLTTVPISMWRGEGTRSAECCCSSSLFVEFFVISGRRDLEWGPSSRWDVRKDIRIGWIGLELPH